MKRLSNILLLMTHMAVFAQQNNTGTTPFELRRNSSATEALKISVGDRSGVLEYVQDYDEGGGTHDLSFNIVSGLSNFYSWKSNGNELFRITSFGNVGIGITNPSAELQINGSGTIAGTNLLGAWALIGSESVGIGIDQNEIMNAGGNLYFGTTGPHNIFFRTSGGNTRLTINPVGDIGIGTTTPTHKLEVNGTIRSQEVKVEANNWPDYVFEPDYELESIESVEAFIQSNGHLPEIPSAAEMETNGLKLGEMNRLLVQKIEELTLYTIDQEKKLEKLDELEDDNSELRIQNEELKERLENNSAQLQSILLRLEELETNKK